MSLFEEFKSILFNTDTDNGLGGATPPAVDKGVCGQPPHLVMSGIDPVLCDYLTKVSTTTTSWYIFVTIHVHTVLYSTLHVTVQCRAVSNKRLFSFFNSIVNYRLIVLGGISNLTWILPMLQYECHNAFKLSNSF